MATAALVCTGCHNHGEEHHEDEHAHSHSSVQVVTGAEGVELFAESAEIEKGEECLLTAYFTSLDNTSHAPERKRNWYSRELTVKKPSVASTCVRECFILSSFPVRMRAY